MIWTAVVAVLAVFVLVGVVFFVIAPRLTRMGKKKRGPTRRR